MQLLKMDDGNPLKDRLKTYWKTVVSIEKTDVISQCPASALRLLRSFPASVIDIAHSKIHTFQFDQVPACWLRLYTDANICKAIRIAQEALTPPKPEYSYGSDWSYTSSETGEETDTNKSLQWLQDVVRLLDMARIVAGAPGRQEMIDQMLEDIETYYQENIPEQPSKRRIEQPSKRRKIEARPFPKAGVDIPIIQFQMSKVRRPSVRNFEKRLPLAQPFVMTESLNHWPAFHERAWDNPDYLLKITFGGRRLVPIELGRSYTDTGWGQSIVPFAQFLDKYVLKATNAASGEDRQDIAYLAQHDLFAQIPSLRRDISIPDYCYTDPPPPEQGTPLASKPPMTKVDEPLLNAWLGPAGTVSPLHTDPYHNILCQVVGRKYVRLYSPFETPKMYPRPAKDGTLDMSNTSLVNAEGDGNELDEYPLFRNASYVETILEPGEALYIPIGWWHYVRALDVSFSVSFWWN